MNNDQRITLGSFLSYFVMSGMLAPIGIISGPMATSFALPVTTVTAGFGWLTFGVLVGAVLALFVLDRVALKRIVVVLYGAIAAALLGLSFTPTAALVWPCLGLVGVACGIGLAAAALAISLCYRAEWRASMLVITDSSFSVAGIACSWLAVFALARGWHWSTTYLGVGGVALVIVALALSARYPGAARIRAETAPQRWPLAVWLCVIALFLYTLGQYSMLWWLPHYLTSVKQIPPDQAGGVVGQFWAGMFVAQLFVAWWVLRLGARRLALLAGAATLAGSVPLWLTSDIELLLVLAFVWGFANLGLLKVVLSFATEQVRVPPPRLVSVLLLGATSGTAVSPGVTSAIVERTGPFAILVFSSACYLAMAILILGAVRSAPLEAPA